jgi:hypothetical protein
MRYDVGLPAPAKLAGNSNVVGITRLVEQLSFKSGTIADHIVFASSLDSTFCIMQAEFILALPIRPKHSARWRSLRDAPWRWLSTPAFESSRTAIGCWRAKPIPTIAVRLAKRVQAVDRSQGSRFH